MPAGQKEPCGHRAQEEAPAPAYRPAAQVRQAAVPAVGAKEPAAQGAQVTGASVTVKDPAAHPPEVRKHEVAPFVVLSVPLAQA